MNYTTEPFAGDNSNISNTNIKKIPSIDQSPETFKADHRPPIKRVIKCSRNHHENPPDQTPHNQSCDERYRKYDSLTLSKEDMITRREIITDLFLSNMPMPWERERLWDLAEQLQRLREKEKEWIRTGHPICAICPSREVDNGPSSSADSSTTYYPILPRMYGDAVFTPTTIDFSYTLAQENNPVNELLLCQAFPFFAFYILFSQRTSFSHGTEKLHKYKMIHLQSNIFNFAFLSLPENLESTVHSAQDAQNAKELLLSLGAALIEPLQNISMITSLTSGGIGNSSLSSLQPVRYLFHDFTSSSLAFEKAYPIFSRLYQPMHRIHLLNHALIEHMMQFNKVRTEVSTFVAMIIHTTPTPEIQMRDAELSTKLTTQSNQLKEFAQKNVDELSTLTEQLNEALEELRPLSSADIQVYIERVEKAYQAAQESYSIAFQLLLPGSAVQEGLTPF